VTGRLSHFVQAHARVDQKMRVSSWIWVEEGGQEGVVMVDDANKTAVKGELDPGAGSDGRCTTRKGLQAGETVLLHRVYGLPEGTERRWQ